jgi:aromatic ring-opening dioxygenase LigB subunit
MLPYGHIMPLTFLVLKDILLMLYKASLNRTMSSNNAASLVPILDETNYR